MSSYFYGLAQGVNKEFLEPDLTIVLKISAKEAIRRLKLEKRKSSIFWKKDLLKRVEKYYNNADKYSIILKM